MSLATARIPGDEYGAAIDEETAAGRAERAQATAVRRRERLVAVLLAVGLALVAAGAAVWSLAAGLAVAGVGLIVWTVVVFSGLP